MPRSASLPRAFAVRCVMALTLTGVLVAGAVVAVNKVIDQKLGSLGRVDVTTAPEPAQGANFLLIGSDTRSFVKNADQRRAFGDTRNAGGQRSDTLMVLHVVPNSGRALVVSFPRDLWVDIPGMGMSKINAAFNSGPDKVIQTFKANYDVSINHYIEVNFQTFQGIVDAVGTVPVYFPYPARDQKTDLYIPVAGCRSLDGPGALAYARSRDLEYYSYPRSRWVSADAVPDLDRIKRQQDFMRRVAAVAVVHSLNNPFTANNVADRIVENLKVDRGLSKNDLLLLVDAFRSVNSPDSSHVEFETLPSIDGHAKNGQAVLYAKDPEAKAMLARLRDFSTVAPPPASTTTTAPAAGTTATTAPALVPAPIANPSQLGAPAPKDPPC